MVSVPLVHIQFVPPRVKNRIRRTRLQNLGLSILSHHVTTVVAPAGYGKSVWISSLLEEPAWPTTAWLSLDRHDSEPSFLLFHLIYAIRKVLPTFGNRSLRTMNSLGDIGRDWMIVVSSLIEEIPKEDQIVLVLDDFHLIDQNTVVRKILEYLIHWLPNGAHLVLISRNNPPLNLNRMQFSGQLLEISSNQLAFSARESQESLLLSGLALTEKEFAMAHSITEGWAAGLRLLGILFNQSGGDVKKTLLDLDLKQKDINLYTYLVNQLLGCLPDELQNFLLDCSLLPYLEPELCDTALACNDSTAKIKQLYTLGILSRIEDETTTWRFNHLMSEFLEQKAPSLLNPDHIISVRRRAAIFLENKGDIDRALEQVAVCSDWPAAVKMLHIHADKHFLQSGRPDALELWLGYLPGNLLNGDHWLLFLKGMSLMHGNSEEALDTLSCAADFARKEGDVKCQLRSLLAMIAVYSFINDTKKIEETAARIPVAASLLDSTWSRGVVMVAALGQAAWGENLWQGVWMSRFTGKISLDPESRMGYLVFSCIIQLRLGNLTYARELMEKHLTDPYVQEDERWVGKAYTIYADLCMLAGDHEKLAEICGGMLHLGQKYHTPYLSGFAHQNLARLYMWKERLDKAREEFKLAREDFITANNVYSAFITDLELFLLRIRAGEDASELMLKAEYELNMLKTPPDKPDQADYALSLAGIIAMEAGQLELARQRFEEIRQKSRRKGARQMMASAQLFLARLSLLQGNEGYAGSCLREVLGAAESEKWEFFRDWHPETVYNLCRYALYKKIHPKWAIHILRRWFPERTRKEAGDLLAHADEGVRQAITMLLQDITREKGRMVVHINCLGEFRVFVNGVAIIPSQWKTKKAENLIKFLIANRRQQVKEKIIEVLWPESDLRLGDASLRMALTHVRQTLKLGEPVRESVILKGGLIYLNPEIEIYTDYDLFASIAQRALENTATDSPLVIELLEQAVKLYRGDFLPENLYDDWTTELRSQLKHIQLQLLLKLVEAYRRQDRPAPAIQTCRRYLAFEPADEMVIRIAMELLWQNGQKQPALALYHKLSAVLVKEYDEVAPAAETKDLYDKIRYS